MVADAVRLALGAPIVENLLNLLGDLTCLRQLGKQFRLFSEAMVDVFGCNGVLALPHKHRDIPRRQTRPQLVAVRGARLWRRRCLYRWVWRSCRGFGRRGTVCMPVWG